MIYTFLASALAKQKGLAVKKPALDITESVPTDQNLTLWPYSTSRFVFTMVSVCGSNNKQVFPMKVPSHY